MSVVQDVRAVIDSAKARDTGQLEASLRERRPDATEEEVAEGIASVTAIIDSVPALIAMADEEAHRRGLSRVVRPLLGHAVRYFVSPLDEVPEMTRGLAGLVDDAYVSFKILDHLNAGPSPLFRWDFDEPLQVLRNALTEHVAQTLDDQATDALREIADDVSKVWGALAREA